MRSISPNESILKVQEIQSYISHYHILENVSFEVPRGSIVALLGRNGAGKTTTLKSIMNLVDVREGQIIFEDKPIQGLTPYEVAQRSIGYVPEHRVIFRDLSVAENLRIAERKRGDFDAKREMIFELFPDLKKFINLRGTELSGGQQQRLCIARILAIDSTAPAAPSK